MGVPSDKPVCVTGATGFIAAHVVQQLLVRGYRVHGTVRSLNRPAKHAHLTSLSGAADRLRLFQADLQTPGSFDAAIAGASAVLHVASPYVLHTADPDRDLVQPAVNGTLNVLRSAAAAGVRRLVLTSSMAAISDEPVAGKVFSEADWNDTSSLSRNPYYYSKALAERAAWRYLDEEKPGFRMAAINPFMVLGPSLGPGINTSNAAIRDTLTGAFPGIVALSWGVVDVRDVADAHVRALENELAHGRYLCAGETLTMREIVEVLRAAGYGERYSLPRLDLSSPSGTRLVRLMSYLQPAGVGSYLRSHIGRVMRYDNARIQRELGLRFRPARETVLATAENLERWGHLARRSRAPAHPSR